MNNCPICDKPAVITCKCPRMDSKCENGHDWHKCPVHFKIVVGQSNHQSKECSCQKAVYPTNELRWLRRDNHLDEYPLIKSSRFSYKLQQKWIDGQGNYEWRDIEIIEDGKD